LYQEDLHPVAALPERPSQDMEIRRRHQPGEDCPSEAARQGSTFGAASEFRSESDFRVLA